MTDGGTADAVDWSLLGLSSLLGLVIGWATINVQQHITATAMQALGNFNRIAIIFGGMLLLGERYGPMAAGGLALALGGSIWFAYTPSGRVGASPASTHASTHEPLAPPAASETAHESAGEAASAGGRDSQRASEPGQACAGTCTSADDAAEPGRGTVASRIARYGDAIAAATAASAASYTKPTPTSSPQRSTLYSPSRHLRSPASRYCNFADQSALSPSWSPMPLRVQGVARMPPSDLARPDRSGVGSLL